MRLFPKMPDNIDFWRKWNLFCIMFTGGCLLASRFCKDLPDVVSNAETLACIGGIGLAFGFIMQFLKKEKR
jgi:hypothetical protein